MRIPGVNKDLVAAGSHVRIKSSLACQILCPSLWMCRGPTTRTGVSTTPHSTILTPLRLSQQIFTLATGIKRYILTIHTYLTILMLARLLQRSKKSVKIKPAKQIRVVQHYQMGRISFITLNTRLRWISSSRMQI